MFKYKRIKFDINENKIKEKYSLLLEATHKKCNKTCNFCDLDDNIRCIKEKWNTNRTDWNQGFDSDCYAHCCQNDICMDIFQDDTCITSKKNTFIETEERIPGNEKPIINLYVDDLRICPKNFEIAKNMDIAKQYLKDFNIDVLSLDHDLGEDENGNILPTGYDLVKFICENNFSINEIYIHTANPVGRENMYQTLLGAQRRGFINENIKINNYPLNY